MKQYTHFKVVKTITPYITKDKSYKIEEYYRDVFKFISDDERVQTITHDSELIKPYVLDVQIGGELI